MGLRANPNPNVQAIAAHQASWWVDQHVLADGRALGIKALQNSQRPLMLEVRDAAAVPPSVVQCQAGVPSHLVSLDPASSAPECAAVRRSDQEGGDKKGEKFIRHKARWQD
jgi:hypothetical protein